MWVWREVKRLESVVAGGGGVNEVEGAGRGSRKVAVRSSVICQGSRPKSVKRRKKTDRGDDDGPSC
jgi:hypothetical protein